MRVVIAYVIVMCELHVNEQCEERPLHLHIRCMCIYKYIRTECIMHVSLKVNFINNTYLVVSAKRDLVHYYIFSRRNRNVALALKCMAS